jgi:hypothetical protein
VATPNTGGFDLTLAARVFSAALAFAAPRVLEAATPESLALWGLHGISALDPALSADLYGGKLQLSTNGHTIFVRTAPSDSDAAGWGHAAAEVEDAAFLASPTLRATGTQGLIQGFFDEMFNHLDPYSRYEPPSPAQAERTKLSVDAGASRLASAWVTASSPSRATTFTGASISPATCFPALTALKFCCACAGSTGRYVIPLSPSLTCRPKPFSPSVWARCW